MGLFSAMGGFSLQHGIGPAVPNNFLGAFHPLNPRGELTVPILVGEDTFNPLVVQEPLTAANARRFVESARLALSDFPYPLFDDDCVIPIAATHGEWEIVEYDPSTVGKAICGEVMVRQRQTGVVVSFDTMEDDFWQITVGMEWQSPDGQKRPATVRLLRTVGVLPDEVGTTGITIAVSADRLQQLFGTSDHCTPLEAGLAICSQYLASRGGGAALAEGDFVSFDAESEAQGPRIPLVGHRNGLQLTTATPPATDSGIIRLNFAGPARIRCHVAIEADQGISQLTMALSAPEGLSDRDLADSVVARWWQSGVRLVRICSGYN